MTLRTENCDKIITAVMDAGFDRTGGFRLSHGGWQIASLNHKNHLMAVFQFPS